MSDFFSKLFDTSDFPARWHCGDWDPFHGWLHIVSDIAVWAAYFTIPLMLIHFARKKSSNILLNRVVFLFAAFILSCGTVHLIDAIIFYHPLYRLSGLTKLLTALVSWVTVFYLWRKIPGALELPELKAINSRLTDELERRRQAEIRAEMANRELKMLSSMVAHDLRNPLSSAVMMADLAVESSELRTSENLSMIADSLRAMNRQLESLKVDLKAGTPAAIEDVDLGALMGDVKAAVSSVILVKRGTLVWEDLPVAKADRDAIFHVCLNLVENALKYSGSADPEIRVSAVRSEDRVLLHFDDNGRGIDPDDRERVFGAGYRSDDSSDRDGHGMGLAFCRRILDEHGWKISAAESPLGGSRLTISLPASAVAGNDGN
ncbi:sensor histidine kinase [Haloferula helveola]|uniref:histidine kinase n=1 Tax=Haloferula helveola TaxID=490095 RepID=A0ABM7RCY4_9BACT|nr:sensor histidine kinase [Haloferula helveola]